MTTLLDLLNENPSLSVQPSSHLSGMKRAVLSDGVASVPPELLRVMGVVRGDEVERLLAEIVVIDLPPVQL